MKHLNYPPKPPPTPLQKNKIKTIANEAASIVGLTLTFKNGTVEIYKDGKRIEELSTANNKIGVPLIRKIEETE